MSEIGTEKRRMKVILNSVLEDWREDVCIYCGCECNPSYRFCYNTDKSDDEGNSLAEFEIEVCRDCCNKIDVNWRNKCENISPKEVVYKSRLSDNSG